MSEQEYCNSDDTFGVRLVNHVDDAVLPVGVHDFADAIGRCMLVDKTMFIADVLDCDASVVVCCRPEGFGKSMNLSMLRAFWSVQRSVALVSVCLPMLRFGMRTAALSG